MLGLEAQDPGRESNHRPASYKLAALPLSYPRQLVDSTHSSAQPDVVKLQPRYDNLAAPAGTVIRSEGTRQRIREAVRRGRLQLREQR